MASNKKKDNSRRNRLWAIIIAVLLSVGGFALAWPPTTSINQGLDIQGGLSVTLTAESTNDEAVTPEQMEKAKAVVENRVNMLGASEATVSIVGANSDQLLVQIPGMSNSTEALKVIGSTGVLEFARLDSFIDEEIKNKIESGDIIDYESSENAPTGDVPLGGENLADTSKYKHITVEEGTYTPIFTGDHITRVTVDKESDTSAYYAVNISLDSEASAKWAEATTELAPTKGKVCIVIDNTIESAPAVQSAITGGQTSITGNYTLEEAKSLETILNSGSLPVSFKYDQAQTVGPTLGTGEFAAAVLAMLIGMIVVILYLFIFYRGMGIIPLFSMLIFACIYIGVFAGMSYMGLFSMSLAGLAGIVLTLGLSFDSFVLCTEKLKEELKEGKSLKSASNTALKHALITSADANIVSILSALALFFLATSTIKGFGLTLSIGIVCNLLVLVIFIVPLMRLLAPHIMRNHPGFWGVKYSIEMGDVRYGTENYKTPVEVTATKTREKEERELKKERASAYKSNSKEAERRAKEIRKERERAEKAEKKEKLEQLKAEDAIRDEERKAAKKAAKESRKDEKEEEKVLVSEEELEGSETETEDVAEEVIEELAGDTAGETGEEIPGHTDIEAPKSDAEIASLIEESMDYEIPVKELPREEDSTVVLTSAETEQEAALPTGDADTGQPQVTTGQPRMNRAQRRAEARNKKNN